MLFRSETSCTCVSCCTCKTWCTCARGACGASGESVALNFDVMEVQSQRAGGRWLKSEKVFISSFFLSELENCVSLLKLYLDKGIKSTPNLHATETNIIFFGLMQFTFLNTFSPLEPVFPFCPAGPESPVSPCGENIT